MTTASLLLAFVLLAAVSIGQCYKIAVPRSLLYEGDDSYPSSDYGTVAVMRKRSFDDVKRGGDKWIATIPRSGLMVGGRGWMPGFRSSSRWWDDASF